MNMTNQQRKTWVLPILEGDTIDIPDDLNEVLGWQVGDELIWESHDDGSFTLTKVKPTE